MVSPFHAAASWDVVLVLQRPTENEIKIKIQVLFIESRKYCDPVIRAVLLGIASDCTNLLVLHGNVILSKSLSIRYTHGDL